MRIAFLSGPANAPEIYRQWSGAERQVYFGTDYMKQFLQLATDAGAESYVITWFGSVPYVSKLGEFTFDNRPLTTARGLAYYFGQLWWHMRAAASVGRFKPDLLVLTGNQNFWWTLAFTRTKFLPSYHSVVWPKYGKVKLPWKVLLWLNQWLVLRRCKVAVVTAKDIARQLEQLTDAEIIHHLPSYLPHQFEGIAPARWSSPFRVFFILDFEVNKGVYDVLEIARRLEAQRPGEFRFDLCGSGGELERARAIAPTNVVCHGFCDQAKVRELIGLSHVSIVPTRTDYEAGFEMTCAESILSDRPLITSAVCPALEYLRDASIEVEPDNVDQYLEAIVRLKEDRELYERKRAACGPLKAQFFDPENSWLNAMKMALSRLGF